MLPVLLMLCCISAFTQTKVGINTTAPSDPLDVNGNVNLRGIIKVNSNAGLANHVLMSKGSSTNPVWANTAYTGAGRFFVIPTNNTKTGSSFTLKPSQP